jgi:inosine/xanthosine triphosphate pyrophosphatase family protein
MNIIFATGNKNKIAEANDLLGELGHTVQGLIIDGKKPNFIEPQSANLLEVALSKISQARSMIKNTDLEGSAILVEYFLHLSMTL